MKHYHILNISHSIDKCSPTRFHIAHSRFPWNFFEDFPLNTIYKYKKISFIGFFKIHNSMFLMLYNIIFDTSRYRLKLFMNFVFLSLCTYFNLLIFKIVNSIIFTMNQYIGALLICTRFIEEYKMHLHFSYSDAQKIFITLRSIEINRLWWFSVVILLY